MPLQEALGYTREATQSPRNSPLFRWMNQDHDGTQQTNPWSLSPDFSSGPAQQLLRTCWPYSIFSPDARLPRVVSEGCTEHSSSLNVLPSTLCGACRLHRQLECCRGYSLIPLEDGNLSSWYGAGPRRILSESQAQWNILVTRVLGHKLWLRQTYKLHSASDSDSSTEDR